MYKFLVIDDNQDILTIFSEIFADTCDCTVHTTLDGEHATNFVKDTKYDLISIDFKLASTSGTDLARTIRKQGLNKSTPILFVSGFLVDCIEDSKDISNVSYIDKKNIYTDVVPLILNLIQNNPKDQVTHP
ncbi:MAG: response regulator [Bacteriovoracaceae bacterium]|nr:response regulator [Bacteriovoracaceae bacterium]